jgi:hypothetical protein
MSSSTFLGTLSLTIIGCKDLDKDLFAKTDPYCYISLGNAFLGGVLDGQGIGKQHFKTKVHENGGIHPVWDETHDFDLKGMKSDVNLTIDVYDRILLKDERLATAELTLAELTKYDNRGSYIPLREKGKDSRVVGNIGFIVKFNCQQIPNDVDALIKYRKLSEEPQDDLKEQNQGSQIGERDLIGRQNIITDQVPDKGLPDPIQDKYRAEDGHDLRLHQAREDLLERQLGGRPAEL